MHVIGDSRNYMANGDEDYDQNNVMVITGYLGVLLHVVMKIYLWHMFLAYVNFRFLLLFVEV